MVRLASQPSEHDEQVTLFRWWRLQYPKQERLLFAIPNGGARNAVTGSRLKDEGVRAGVPDMLLAMPTERHAGLFLELKRQRGTKVSPVQSAMINDLARAGYAVAVCYGFEEARRTIQAYLAGEEIPCVKHMGTDSEGRRCD